MRYTAPMNRTINQRELRNESAKVLREVQAGREEVDAVVDPSVEPLVNG